MRIPEEEVGFGFKIIIVGAGGAGKTALFNRYCFNSFNMNTKMTIGISFHSTYLKVKYRNGTGNYEEKYVINSIFDFGGQERFRPLIPKFLEGAQGALLVFDSVSFLSFQQLNYWYEKLEENIGPNIPKILVASKCDLLDKTPTGEIVDEDLIQEFVDEKAINGYFRTSALKNHNVLKVFKSLTKLMLDKHNIEAVIV